MRPVTEKWPEICLDRSCIKLCCTGDVNAKMRPHLLRVNRKTGAQSCLPPAGLPYTPRTYLPLSLADDLTKYP